VEIAVQVNGRVRDRISVPVDVTRDAALACAMASPRVVAAIGPASVTKTILVPGKLLNIVVQTA
jgi:leucyl-tRNA synthetase